MRVLLKFLFISVLLTSIASINPPSSAIFTVVLDELPSVYIEVKDGQLPIITSYISGQPKVVSNISVTKVSHFIALPWDWQYTYCLNFEDDNHCHTKYGDDSFIKDFATFWDVQIDFNSINPFTIYDIQEHPQHPTVQQYKNNMPKLNGKYIFIYDE
jgi:hypothetical protein